MYHDLFTLSSDRGIYWLRLYRHGSGRFEALVTEVPGNPGMSVTNGASMIRTEISTQFHINERSIDLIEIWPRLQWIGAAPQRSSLSRVPTNDDDEWQSLTRRQLESEVGALPAIPEHDEVFRRVLDRGGRRRETTEAIWEAIAVESLPPPHHAYQCKYAGALQQNG